MRLKWLIAVALLLPLGAAAAGMGRLSVLSALGQPFNAEIELIAVQKEELATLTARLAAPDAYAQAQLQYGGALVGLRISVERRADGQPFIKITSLRPVNDPFLDLLIELNWSSGRLVREFTALLDPPGSAPAPSLAPAPDATPPARALIPVPSTARPAEPARAAGPEGTYGPIERGETLSKIASGLKPDGVTLEQMLVGLFRSNPDAFIRKNMNLVRSGKILRVPARDEIVAITQSEAVKEYRAQVSDWKSYRAQVSAAPADAREGGSAASGRIATRVEDKTAAEPKDVVRLSKGEAPQPGVPGTGAKASAERIRTLEEEVTARDKALKEANERIAQLEKTVKDMQRLAEIKSAGLATAQQQAQAKADAKPAPAAPEIKAAATPSTPGKPEAPPPPKVEEKPAPPADATKPTEAAAPKPPAEKPKPKPEVKAQPKPPAPEPSLTETISDPLYLGGGAAILLGGLGYWLMRRRREQSAAEELPTAPVAPTIRPYIDAAPTQPVAQAAPVAGEDLDPVDEASVYITHGRDAQAEAVLKEAIAQTPEREALHVKLLEIYALRKDKAGFVAHAADFHQRTGGKGDNWIKVAAMGLGIDPENPLFGGSGATPVVVPAAPTGVTSDLDFNLDAPAADSRNGATAQAAAPDFEIEVPPVDRAPQAAAATSGGGGLDFEIEVPKLDVSPPAVPSAPERTVQDPGAGLDFKIDLGALNLDLDGKNAAAAAPAGERDPHWHDVQAKFDLARAFQDMGERAQAAEVLREVLREGNDEQQARAKGLLDALG